MNKYLQRVLLLPSILLANSYFFISNINSQEIVKNNETYSIKNTNENILEIKEANPINDIVNIALIQCVLSLCFLFCFRKNSKENYILNNKKYISIKIYEIYYLFVISLKKITYNLLYKQHISSL